MEVEFMARKTFKKIITDEETLKKINPDNKELCKIFLKDKARKCSDETLKQYESALNIFMCWNVKECKNEFYPLIKKREISSFFDYICDELKVNGKRFSFFKSVLSGLSDCVIKYYDEDDRCLTFRNFISAIIENVPKTDVREKTVLEEKDLNNLLEILTTQNKYQEACLASLAAYSGMRISELEQMQVKWISEDSLAYNGLFYETEPMRTKGSGKQGKVIARLILHDLFKPYFDKWIEERTKILNKLKVPDHGMLFINRDGQPASQVVIRRFIASWEKILNVNLYAHLFRHFFCTLLKTKYKLSDEVVKTLVRWSSIDLVSVYNDKSEEIDMSELESLRQGFEVSDNG